jgi:hypothetical protein
MLIDVDVTASALEELFCLLGGDIVCAGNSLFNVLPAMANPVKVRGV